MKRLCLIRHGKSSWFHSKSDFDRPLEERGEHEAKLTGDILHKKGFHPDLILTSPAKRSFDTALEIANKLQYPQENIISDQRLYEARVEDLIDVLQKINALHNNIILIGHNPGITCLVNYLAQDYIASLPNCGIYGIEFDTDNWEEITIVEGKTLFMEVPSSS